MAMQTKPVLIVGAGPTGLVLACDLAMRKIPFRIISASKGPGLASRAMAVQARTLEFYQQMGISDGIVDLGIKMARLHFREADESSVREIAALDFRNIGEGLSPFPFVLALPQDDHERFLADKLRALGVNIEWGAALTQFTQTADGVQATLTRRDADVEVSEFSYICGCDGAHSVVRHTIGVTFEGAPYAQRFYVADAQTSQPYETDIIANIGKRLLVLMFPVRSSGMQRLIGLVPPEAADREPLQFDDIRASVEAILRLQVTQVNWFSAYHVHHRVAGNFRVGRAFLLGDAGHLHSPVGGQGMNTGIGDAINLGWKLAQVIEGRAPDALLDSYDVERRAFARFLVETTDRVFTPMIAPGWIGFATRRIAAPLIMKLLSVAPGMRRLAFRTLSQIRVRYRASPLSSGKAGGIAGGDRLPWLAAGADNFAALRSRGWQTHVFGSAPESLARACSDHSLALHEFEHTDAVRSVGFAKGAAYVIRPDGYVALAIPASETDMGTVLDRAMRRLASVGSFTGAAGGQLQF